MSIQQVYLSILSEEKEPMSLCDLLQQRQTTKDLKLITKQVWFGLRRAMESAEEEGKAFRSFSVPFGPVYSVKPPDPYSFSLPFHLAGYGHKHSHCFLSFELKAIDCKEVRPMNEPDGFVQVTLDFNVNCSSNLSGIPMNLSTLFANFITSSPWSRFIQPSIRSQELDHRVTFFMHGDSRYEKYQTLSSPSPYYSLKLVEEFLASRNFVDMLRTFVEFVQTKVEAQFHVKLQQQLAFVLQNVFAQAAQEAPNGLAWYRQEVARLDKLFAASVVEKASELIHEEDVYKSLKLEGLTSFLPLLKELSEGYNAVHLTTPKMFGTAARIEHDSLVQRADIWGKG